MLFPFTIQKERLHRRNLLFKTYPGKDLLHNPFYILEVTQRDNKQRIIEQAEEQSLLSDPEKCQNLQNTLIFPRKRISAEIAWLPGVSPNRVNDTLLLFETSAGNRTGNSKVTSFASNDSLVSVLLRIPYAESETLADEVLESLISPDQHSKKEDNIVEISKFLGFDKLIPIARANLLAARMLRLPDYTPDIVVKGIFAIAQTYDKINPSEVRAVLNDERQQSGFPEITHLSDIKTAIQDIRHYYKQVIKFVLESIYTVKERAQTVMTIVESATENNPSNLPILIEDAIDSYEDIAQTSLVKEEKKIEEYDKKLRIAAENEEHESTFSRTVDGLNDTVKDWVIIAQPIQINKRRRGLKHAASHDISERVRLLAIFLFNEYDKLNSSQKILNTLNKVFSEFPEITERITADLETLNKISQQRENNSQVSLFDN